MNNKTTKTTRGRQKIEIKKIENTAHRQVTFTKRRGGLFKKACEICILTAAEAAVIVKSPGERIFSFGHPSVEAVVERYLGRGGSPNSEGIEDLTRGLVLRYDNVAQELKVEKRRREVILDSSVPNGDPARFWWEEPIDGVVGQELESYEAAMIQLWKNINRRTDEMMLMTSSNSLQYFTPINAIYEPK